MLLGGNHRAVLGDLNDGLRAHPPALGGEIDALTGAFGDVSRGVTDQGHPADHTAGTGVLGDRMGFDLDHFAFEQALVRPLPDALLQTFDQALVLLHGAGAHGHVVVFGEDPGVEVR